jgi:hypothetical protein
VKKILFILAITPILIIIVFFSNRYNKNLTKQAPYPYIFANKTAKLKIDAPILIIGDQYGAALSALKEDLASKISEGLSTPIKIETLAMKGEGAHRTLNKIKNLEKLPLVIIYLGGSQEEYENKFLQKDLKNHLTNFKYFENTLIQSLLMIYPVLSKFIYIPIDHVTLGPVLADTNRYTHLEVQKRRQLSFKIYENELDEIFRYIKDHNAYLFALTSPLNIELKPKDPCNKSLDETMSVILKDIESLALAKDFKGAYQSSRDLSLMANTNSNVLYLHGQIAKSLNKKREAKKNMEMAIVYDCAQDRGSPIFNAIIKKKALKYAVTVFDLQRFISRNLGTNPLFIDEKTVQSLYLEQLTTALASRIKILLKM